MKLGIDIGTFSMKAVVLDQNNNIIWKRYAPHRNKVKETLLDILDELEEKEYDVGICGSMKHLTGLDEYSYNELLCLCRAQSIRTDAKSIIHLGAQRTYYIALQEGKKPLTYRNGNCSSGTGSFFEEQAGKLGIPLDHISDLTDKAETIPNIAGRCSVFSKTDMIHKMQEGVSQADLLIGLCYALVRNFKGSVLKNRDVLKPVLLSGGVMKNRGVVRALRDLFGLDSGDYILEENADHYCAVGAAMYAERSLPLREIKRRVRRAFSAEAASALMLLSEFADDGDGTDWKAGGFVPGNAYLGIDVGSTSINLVLLGEGKEVEYVSYVKNIGKPLIIVREEIDKLMSILPSDTVIKQTAVTGSGREFIARQIGADIAVNEITAQTMGAVLNLPDTDTIFEIGGQDSKYMSVLNGEMVDFEMNKVCAAGTGAFLEEQIAKLGISMEEFLRYAMQSKAPCELGDRCTVFIESSITGALGEGRTMPDICAGLAYAVASNYLGRVVNQKPIGNRITVQGGIAYNTAVVCAFRGLTGKKVSISPYFSVTGALGAAAICMRQSGFSFDVQKNRLMNAALSADTEKSYLGGYDYADVEKAGKKGKTVGIPRVLFLHKMFPLFRTIFTRLGFSVVLSPLTNDDIVIMAQRYTVEETCYPIKLVHGHIAWLIAQGVDYIVLPRLYTIRHEGSTARKDYSCMYMQTSPLMMEQVFHFKDGGITLISPELSLDFGMRFMVNSILSMAETIGVSRAAMIPCAIAGVKAVIDHTHRLEALGDRHFDANEPTFVLITRVYNLADPALNMGIEEHLNKMGCRVVHLEHLHASYMNVTNDYKDLYWPFGQHILTGLNIIRENSNFYPIYITNHGCGPDTAIQHYLKHELDGRSYLHLEVDEHTSKIGIITRLEAFLHSLKRQQAVHIPSAVPFAADTCLIADFGEYSGIIAEKSKLPVQNALPVKHSTKSSYAINKEYYSLLVTMEEILSCADKSKNYEMPFPTDEGSEVFGQYGHLIEQELQRQGYSVSLRPFYIEDLIERTDADYIFKRILDIDCKGLQELTERPVIAVGEPLCVYKESIFYENTKYLQNAFKVVKMPLSEALLFHLTDIDRKGKHKKQLSLWKEMHGEAVRKYGGYGVFTELEELFANVRGKLDFMVGDFAKYRFAKLLCMTEDKVRGAVLLNSAEENTAIILKLLCEAYKKEIAVPTVQADIDFSHSMSRDDAELFIGYADQKQPMRN